MKVPLPWLSRYRKQSADHHVTGHFWKKKSYATFECLNAFLFILMGKLPQKWTNLKTFWMFTILRYTGGTLSRPVNIRSWVSSLVSSLVSSWVLDFSKSWVKSWVKIQDLAQDLFLNYGPRTTESVQIFKGESRDPWTADLTRI